MSLIDPAALRATARPHWVASLSRGRIPVEKMMKSTSSACCRRQSAWFYALQSFLNDLFGVLAGGTFTPMLSILRRSWSPPVWSSCSAISIGANSMTWVSTPRFFQRACRFQTQQTAADYCAATAATGAGSDGVEVFNGTVDEAILSFRAFDLWDPRIGAVASDQLVVKTVRPALEWITFS